MSILTILLVLIIAGLVLYLVNRFIPMEGNIKSLLNWVVIIFLIVWLLKAFGVFAMLGNARI